MEFGLTEHPPAGFYLIKTIKAANKRSCEHRVWQLPTTDLTDGKPSHFTVLQPVEGSKKHSEGQNVYIMEKHSSYCPKYQPLATHPVRNSQISSELEDLPIPISVVNLGLLFDLNTTTGCPSIKTQVARSPDLLQHKNKVYDKAIWATTSLNSPQS